MSRSILNARDIAQWLGSSRNTTLNFRASVRSVQLELDIQVNCEKYFISSHAHCSNKKQDNNNYGFNMTRNA